MNIAKEPTRGRLNQSRLHVWFCLCGIALMNLLPLPCYGIEAGNTESVLSITSTGEPLHEVLSRISEATGYEIVAPKGWEKVPIAAKLDHVTLEEGIKEIIRSMGRPNYAMTINDGAKKVEIKIYDAVSGYSPAAGNSLAEMRQKQTGAALDAFPVGQYRNSEADTGAKADSVHKTIPPPVVQRPDETAIKWKVEEERALMQRKMEEERALMQRKREEERRVMENEMERKMPAPPEMQMISPVNIIPPNQVMQ
jgi:hypothetical protein